MEISADAISFFSLALYVDEESAFESCSADQQVQFCLSCYIECKFYYYRELNALKYVKAKSIMIILYADNASVNTTDLASYSLMQW